LEKGPETWDMDAKEKLELAATKKAQVRLHFVLQLGQWRSIF
jgi:hypothetical protein